ncbi:Vesicle-associated protein 4-2 [Linum grandiflorum]
MPFWQTAGNATTTSSSSSSSSSNNTSSTSSGSMNSTAHYNNRPAVGDHYSHGGGAGGGERSTSTPATLSTATAVSLVAKSLIPTRRRLKLDPASKLFFPYEPGKQVRSAIGIKNICKSHIAFKFQTTAPKSCYMRPPGGILAPGESLIATVFKFVEPPENNEKQVLDVKSRVKFKIMSLKVKGEMEYVPELFDEQKEQVAVEQILRVVFLDPETQTPALQKLKRQLAEAEAELENRKKAPEEPSPRTTAAAAAAAAGEGLVIDEWKERRERYLAQQQVELGPV